MDETDEGDEEEELEDEFVREEIEEVASGGWPFDSAQGKRGARGRRRDSSLRRLRLE